MTKAEWVKRVREALPSQTSSADVERVMDAVTSTMAAELLGGGEVAFLNVGKLKVRATAARKGRNPQTQEAIDIPAGQKVVFVPSKELKEALRG